VTDVTSVIRHQARNIRHLSGNIWHQPRNIWYQQPRNMEKNADVRFSPFCKSICLSLSPLASAKAAHEADASYVNLVSKVGGTPSPSAKAAPGEEVPRAACLGNLVKTVGGSPSPSTKPARGQGLHPDHASLGNLVSAINQPYILIFAWDSTQFRTVPYSSVHGLAHM
jgi:hypothetical protein